LSKRKLFLAVSLIVLISLLLVVSVPPAKAQFVLSSWDYLDEYGQGIVKIGIEQNSTGAWLPLGDPWDSEISYYESSEVVFDYAGASIKLTVWTWLNGTLIGASGWEDGMNYHRHNVTVTSSNGTTIFNQANFTFGGCFPAINPPMWYY